MEISFNNFIRVNLDTPEGLGIIVNQARNLFNEYNFPLIILEKHLKGKTNSRESLFSALCCIHKELKAKGYKTELNSTTYNKDDFITKVSASVSEYVVRHIWEDLKFISEENQIKYNLGDYQDCNRNVFDIKSKRRKSIPSPSYDITIPYSQKNQKAHYYICTHICWQFKEVVLMGMISKKDFWEKARCVKNGEIASNDVKYKGSPYIIPYSEIHKWDSDYSSDTIVSHYR